MKRTNAILIVLFLFTCHVYAKDIKETIYIPTPKAGKVPFKHEPHLAPLNNNCSACHNTIFHINRKKNKPATMAEMEKEGKSCGACHSEEKNPLISVKLNDCSICHPIPSIPIDIPNFGFVTFSHDRHLTVSFTCYDCHDALFKANRDNPHITMSQMVQGKSCGACHDGKTVFSVKGDCVKCHAVRDIDFAGGSVFSHAFHIGISYNCSDCHNNLFVASKDSKRYTMLDMEKGLSCGACHDGKTAFNVKSDCAKCHKNVRDISFKAFQAKFSHTSHISLFKCSDCHSGIFIGGIRSIRYTMPQMEKGQSCGACHDGKTAFASNSNCDKCHHSIEDKINLQITDIGKVSFSHLSHKSIFKCADCHNGIFTTGVAAKRYSMAEMEKGQSCGACHDGKTAFTVKKGCGTCHPVKEILMSDDARFSHDKHLEFFSCTECHAKLYKASNDNKRFTMPELDKGNSCGACHNSKTAFASTGDCDKCHKSTVNVTYNIRETGVTLFSHAAHKDLFKCVDCHNSIFVPGKNSKRRTMAEMEKGQSCGACHDGKTAFAVKDSCIKCHPVKNIQFKPGTAVFPHMAHLSMYGCKDCHPLLFIPGPNNKKYTMNQMAQGKSCGACHDGKTGFSVTQNCEKCHPGNMKSIRYELSQNIGNVDFSHKTHTEKGYSCSDCHYDAVPSGASGRRWVMRDMDNGKFCGKCHGFSMAFSVKDANACEKCHKKEEEEWKPKK